MFFSFKAYAISVVALAQIVVAALTPGQVVTNVNIVATISSNANSALVPLAVIPTTVQIQTASSSLVNSFQLIINNLAADVSAMAATPPFTDDEADEIVPVIDGFIAIHQTLLGTVIGKQSIFAQFGVTAPVAAVLRSLEAGVDSFAASLVNLIPTKAAHVQIGAGQLDQTVQAAITTFSQICIPSPLYPTIKPICIAV